MFPACILLSIVSSTASTVTSVIAFFPLDGVIVCSLVVGVIVLVSPTNSTTLPSTPNIVTPSFIFSAAIPSSSLMW